MKKMYNKRVLLNSAIVENNVGKIDMYGDVYNEVPIDFWTGQPISEQVITLKDFREALEELSNCAKIEIHLSSEGGDATAGVTIHNILRALDKPTTCIVDGIAASAAFTIATGCDEVLVYPGSVMMCHNVKDVLCGAYSIADLERCIRSSEVCNKAAASMYAQKSGMTVDQVQVLMNAETWMTGADAVYYGFADRLIDGSPSVTAVNKNTMSIKTDKTQKTGGKDMSLMEKFQKHFADFVQSLAEEENNDKKDPAGETVEAPAAPEAPENDKPAADSETVEAPEASEAPEDDEAKKLDASKTQGAEEERTRLKEIDDIAGSIDEDLVKEAKYGETACDAKELAMRQLMRDSQKSQTALDNLTKDGADSKTNSVTSLPPSMQKLNKEEERKQAAADLRAKINKVKGGK